MARADLACEHKLLREFKAHKSPPRRLILALSGGVDSMVLAEILRKWSRGLRLEIAVAHVHHGAAGSERQKKYRREARKLVRAWAKSHGYRFFTNKKAPKLKSEEEFRDFRELNLRNWAEECDAQAVVYAHHRDDLLETRMIRLIRGSGKQGLEAMAVLKRGKFRPMLGLSRVEIEAYARSRNLQWLEDPSNGDEDVLRNWLRREWLPSLENQRPGSLGAMARSLAQVVEKNPLVSKHEFDFAPYVGLRREIFASGPRDRARQILAQYLKALGLKGYTHRHVEEILKRLCSNRQNQAFTLLGTRFQLSVQFLWASRV